MTDTTAPPDRLRELVSSSIGLIEGEQASSGAYPACTTFSQYGYAWLRDGSFVADGLSRQGRTASPTAFHDWVREVVTERRDRIEGVVRDARAGRPLDPAACLPTRYTLDGKEGDESWWDFQLDGYGTWLWALRRHLLAGGDDVRGYAEAVALTVRYLSAVWRHPCYDWWEEHDEQVHVSTLASVQAGLVAALRLRCLPDELAMDTARTVDEIAAVIAGDGTVHGRLRKWLGSDAVDASLLAAVAPFGVVDDAVAAETVAAVERDLVRDHGVHRFRADVFYGGGRWPVLAALLGHAYLRLGRPADALAQLHWIAGTADADGRLPEQVSDVLLAPDSYQGWVDRWGTVARPLLWSHSAFLALAADLGVTERDDARTAVGPTLTASA